MMAMMKSFWGKNRRHHQHLIYYEVFLAHSRHFDILYQKIYHTACNSCTSRQTSDLVSNSIFYSCCNNFLCQWRWHMSRPRGPWRKPRPRRQRRQRKSSSQSSSQSSSRMVMMILAPNRVLMVFPAPGSNDTRRGSPVVKRQLNFGVFKKERILFEIF